MAPKKKGGKKDADDWEAELGEGPDAGSQTANTGDVDVEAETEIGGGGLLAALKKNKTKRAKKGKLVDDLVEGEDPPGSDGGMESSTLTGKAPEETNLDTNDMFTGTAEKGKPGKKAPEKPPEEQVDGEKDEDGGVKSKKEKEKEKKEREKQRKKEQAAKKKATVAAPASKVEPVDLTPEVKPEAPQAAGAVNKKKEPPAHTAAHKKQQEKQTKLAAEEREAEEESQRREVEEKKSKDEAQARKKKKLPAHLAAIQKQQEALQKQREEQARLDAEAKAAEEERQRREAEDEKRKEEARARRKEKEREKKEQLKKEGKLLSEAEKKRKAQQDLRMKQMLDAGVKVEGLKAETDLAPERKKPAMDKKKKPPKKPEEDLEAAAERARLQAEEAEKQRERLAEEVARTKADADANEATASHESDGIEDWEQAANVEEIKDSWDADSDDQADATPTPPTHAEKQEGPVTNGTKLSDRIPQTKDGPTGSESEDESSSQEEGTTTQKATAQKKAEAAARRQKAHEEALAARSADNLRSPICCILGHVDTGKTKLLDKIRQTNVQEGEAGGITQQIGATYFPTSALQEKIAAVNKDGKFDFKVPGLLVIDTPGHESFSNLRSRGSSLCNIAILVVDIMHGLEPQTLESMRLLRDRKTPFIVALNKIDRLYGWRKIDNNGFLDSLAMQNKGVQGEFRDRLERTKVAFAEQGFNSELFSENKSMAKNVSLVPTSAHTGEGIPDMLKLLITLTQERMTNKLMYLSEVECTVLEVKVIEGLGTTIDVILSNGVLREGDRIVLCGLNGAITANIRALLTPAPLKELRLKSAYVHNKEAKASLGLKIAANDLEGAIAGSRLLVVGAEDDEEDLEDEVMGDLAQLLNKVSKDSRGVSVQASTLGSLEALLEFLKSSKIPVANISIGPVYKRDVMMAGTMLEKAKQYAVMLCFDVKVDKEAQAYADEMGVKIFTADIIYHLFDDFTKHMAALAEQKKEENKLSAVFPCVLTPVKVFNKKDPIIIGVDVTDGNLRLTTPIAAVKTNPVTNVKEVIHLGRVTSIERDHKHIPLVKKGQPSVAIKIEGPNQPLYGRQLEESDTLYSLISRTSIDTLKEFYRADVSTDEWQLIRKLKPLFDIP